MYEHIEEIKPEVIGGEEIRKKTNVRQRKRKKLLEYNPTHVSPVSC